MKLTLQLVLLSLMLQQQPHLNLGSCAGFALANFDSLGRTIAFYQVFFQQGRAFGLGNFWRLEQIFAVLTTSSKFCLSEQLLSKI